MAQQYFSSQHTSNHKRASDLVDLEWVAKGVLPDGLRLYFPQRLGLFLEVLLVVAHVLYWDVVQMLCGKNLSLLVTGHMTKKQAHHRKHGKKSL